MTELSETKARQEQAQRKAQDLAAAQPQTPEDRFATCPKCGYTTMQLIVNDTSAGTTRQCLSCSHEWTIKHQKRAS